ncbi:MAG TPA: hypothetical protein VMI09_06975 [Candidatus Binataceae bacterium]|nr:hypothetical protein [Candidatus Binataceae bacterium]
MTQKMHRTRRQDAPGDEAGRNHEQQENEYEAWPPAPGARPPPPLCHQEILREPSKRPTPEAPSAIRSAATAEPGIVRTCCVAQILSHHDAKKNFFGNFL